MTTRVAVQTTVYEIRCDVCKKTYPYFAYAEECERKHKAEKFKLRYSDNPPGYDSSIYIEDAALLDSCLRVDHVMLGIEQVEWTRPGWYVRTSFQEAEESYGTASLETYYVWKHIDVREQELNTEINALQAELMLCQQLRALPRDP